MLYRDGSGLQKLAKGTASQELRMNSGATAPEWHTPAVASADYVKVASGTHSGAYLQVDNCFTSAYPLYKIFIYNHNGGAYTRFNFRTGGASGSNFSGSNYRFRTKYFNVNSSNNQGDTGENGYNESTIRFGYNGDISGLEWTIIDPYNSSTNVSFWGIRDQTGSEAGFAHVGGYVNNASSMTGFRFYTEGSSSFTCKYAVYGMKI